MQIKFFVLTFPISQFDSGAAPRGGRITNCIVLFALYLLIFSSDLLEKTRVTYQAGDER